MAYPYFTAPGTLQSVAPKIIELASNRIGRKLCIDLNNNERLVVFNPQNGEVTVVNSNLKNRWIGILAFARSVFHDNIKTLC